MRTITPTQVTLSLTPRIRNADHPFSMLPVRGLGALFAAHAKYAHLLLERSADGPTTREIRAAA